jgi:hypothetical protein
MTEYVYIGARMNVSLPPVFRKRIASVEVVIWAAISNDRKPDLVHVPGNLTAVTNFSNITSCT